MALPTADTRIAGSRPRSPTGMFGGATGAIPRVFQSAQQQAAPAAPTPPPVGAPISQPVQAVPLSGGTPLGTLPGGGGLGGFQSTFTRTGGGGGSFRDREADLSVNPQFEQTLLERMQGETGGPSWEQVVEGQFDPFSSLLDRQFGRAQENALADLARRGVLQSGETTQVTGDLQAQLADLKGERLGQLASDFERQRQDAINNALQQFGILEGNRIGAKATITSANIGAAAQVQSAAIQAGATVQAAAIGAQAQIQAAGMNASVARAGIQAQNERFLIGQGLDPNLFQNDPQYRADWVAYGVFLRDQMEFATAAENRQRGTDLALPRR